MEDEVIYHNKGKIENSSKEVLYYLSFFIWPLGTLLASFKHWDKTWTKNIFWFFCVFFGLTFIIGKDDGPDSYYYATLFTQYSQSDLSILGILKSFLSENSGSVDIAATIIIFLASRISHNPQSLFIIFGLIFGYFYSRNIWYVLGHIKSKIDVSILLFIITLALFNPIWNIGNFRFWVAAQIFVFGTLPYLLEGNIKRLFWVGVSVLFHFSFLFASGILLMFILFKNRINIYITFFLLTSFIKELDLQSIQNLLSFLPEVFQPRISAYTNLDYAESINILLQSNNWYLAFSSEVIGWSIYLIVFYINFFCRTILKNRKDLMTLFCFSLLLVGFSNIFSHIPSGDRFLLVSNVYMFALFILFFTAYSEIKGLRFVKAISSPMLLLFCLVAIRGGMDFYGLFTIFGNPFFSIVHSDTTTLIEGIKKLIL
jgi:hypothetical protein